MATSIMIAVGLPLVVFYCVLAARGDRDTDSTTEIYRFVF